MAMGSGAQALTYIIHESPAKHASPGCTTAVPATVLLFCSPGLQAGVSGEICSTGRFNGLPWFRLQPSSKPLVEAVVGKPPEGG